MNLKKSQLKSQELFFNGKIAYICNNQEELSSLLELCKPVTFSSSPKIDFPVVVYYLGDLGKLFYTNQEFAAMNGQPMINLFEDVHPEFALGDLRTGNVVMFRNGKFALVLKDTPAGDVFKILERNGAVSKYWKLFTEYDNLLNTVDDLFDIIEVFSSNHQFLQGTLDHSDWAETIVYSEPEDVDEEECEEPAPKNAISLEDFTILLALMMDIFAGDSNISLTNS